MAANRVRVPGVDSNACPQVSGLGIRPVPVDEVGDRLSLASIPAGDGHLDHSVRGRESIACVAKTSSLGLHRLDHLRGRGNLPDRGCSFLVLCNANGASSSKHEWSAIGFGSILIPSVLASSGLRLLVRHRLAILVGCSTVSGT